jgi:uncharacterized membrane protein
VPLPRLRTREGAEVKQTLRVWRDLTVSVLIGTGAYVLCRMVGISDLPAMAFAIVVMTPWLLALRSGMLW